MRHDRWFRGVKPLATLPTRTRLGRDIVSATPRREPRMRSMPTTTARLHKMLKRLRDSNWEHIGQCEGHVRRESHSRRSRRKRFWKRQVVAATSVGNGSLPTAHGSRTTSIRTLLVAGTRLRTICRRMLSATTIAGTIHLSDGDGSCDWACGCKARSRAAHQPGKLSRRYI